MIRAINRARASHGLRRLLAGRRLARAADAHSRNMLRADFFSHGAFSQRVRRYVRYRSIGETIAMTSRCSAGTVVRMWLNSARATAPCCCRAASAAWASAAGSGAWLQPRLHGAPRTSPRAASRRPHERTG